MNVSPSLTIRFKPQAAEMTILPEELNLIEAILSECWMEMLLEDTTGAETPVVETA